MTKELKRVFRYSNCFKLRVVQEISNGSSISELRNRYGIKGAYTVQRWIKKFGRTELLSEIIYVKTRTEMDRIKDLESENKRLKIALADATLAKDALESLLEVASEHYQTDIKKNLGSELSFVVKKSKDKK